MRRNRPDSHRQQGAALELLKGTSGVQAGHQLAPGGLVNLVVKRPRGDSSQFLLGQCRQDPTAGSVGAAADIGDRRLGADGRRWACASMPAVRVGWTHR